MWKTITEVSGRKTFSRSKNKLSSQEERVELRKKQFEDLIAKLKKKFKTLWPFFMNWVELSQGYSVTTRRQFTFYYYIFRTSWYLFDRPRKDERQS